MKLTPTSRRDSQRGGEKMREIARQRQVLCITDPRPWSPPPRHHLVTKEVSAGRTLTEIRLLDKAERVTELARMLGGQSATARQHAATLIKASDHEHIPELAAQQCRSCMPLLLLAPLSPRSLP